MLLAKGGYGEWPRRELAGMVAAVRATRRYPLVEGAFVDQGAPHLPRVLQQCRAAGARRILVVPVFVPVDRTLREWLPKVLRRWFKKYHIHDTEVVLAPPLGDHPALAAAVAAAVADAEGGADVRVGAPVRDRADQWLEIPPYRYHALLCAGPRCATLGSLDLWAHLHRRLDERDLSERPGGVLSVHTGCLFPCNLGPMMVVHPDNCWYGALDERAIDQIVDAHFAGGRPVEAHLRPRSRHQPT